ncbi:Scn5a [Symbiodinium sp. CCMP2592]|nr:Scn5a [Symbiodinium sp. CCMP2592]
MGTIEGRPAGANAQFGCSCHCGGGAGGPRLKRQDSGGVAAAEIPVRVASSPDVKTHEETKGRSDASPSQLSISKAAVQAAHNLATGASDSTQLMSDAADEPAPTGESKAKVMLPIAAVTPRQVLDSDEEQEFLSDGQPRTEGSSGGSTHGFHCVFPIKQGINPNQGPRV